MTGVIEATRGTLQASINHLQAAEAIEPINAPTAAETTIPHGDESVLVEDIIRRLCSDGILQADAMPLRVQGSHETGLLDMYSGTVDEESSK